MADYGIDETRNGGNIAVRPGDRIILRLSEVPTTGFRWRIEDIGEDAVALEREDFQLAEASAVGGGGIKMFFFRAVRPGSSRLRLARSREWDRSRVDVPLFDLTVEVQAE